MSLSHAYDVRDRSGPVAELAGQLRVDSIRSSTSAGSGHPTSSMSAADLLAVLVARHLRYDWDDPALDGNDHLIFSKGHASPLLYSVFKAVGVVSDEELMTGYRRFGQRLEGHPTPVLPWVDVATGSLGQGLPDGVGVALAGKYLDRLPYRVWVLCGDSEMAEGSIWEALDKASYYQLSNLIAIVDVNRLGQRGPTELGWDLDAYARRAEAFGARVLAIDGHDLAAIDEALTRPTETAEPADGDLRQDHQGPGLLRGRGQARLARQAVPAGHGRRAPSPSSAANATWCVRGPLPRQRGRRRAVGQSRPRTGRPPRYTVGEKVATRKAYGDALVALGARDPKVVALDGEVSNSTYADEFAKAYPERYFEMFIAEQQLVAAATGLAVRGLHAVRLHLRRVLHPRVRLHPHGRDLRRRPAPGRLARRRRDRRRRPVPDGPGGHRDDARGPRLDRALSERRDQHRRAGGRHGGHAGHQLHAHHPRRLSRPLPGGETFPVGGSKVLRVRRPDDDVTLIGAGVTLHAVPAPRPTRLAEHGVHARVIDCTRSSRSTPRRSSRRPPPRGAASSSPRTTIPRAASAPPSWTPCSPHGAPTCPSPTWPCARCQARARGEELLAWAGIDADHIAAAARTLIDAG